SRHNRPENHDLQHTLLRRRHAARLVLHWHGVTVPRIRSFAVSAISSNLGQVFSGSMPGSVAPASQGIAAANGDLAASVGAAGASQSHSASSVMIDSQATTLLSTFQTALESQDTLKMMLAMLILDALGGKDKDEKD